MRFLKQFSILCLFTFLGEACNSLLPFPIPSGVYALILLFFALQSKLLKLEQVEETADFLLSIMPVMFVPATVSLMTQWGILKNYWFSFIIACLVSTVIVMVVTGRIAQTFFKNSKKGERKL